MLILGSPDRVSVGEICSFITGASTIPVIGLDEDITVRFTDENRMPYASTCSPSLTIPYKIESQNKFNEIMTYAVLGSAGFGFV